MILVSGAGGRGFDSRSSPYSSNFFLIIEILKMMEIWTIRILKKV